MSDGTCKEAADTQLARVAAKKDLGTHTVNALALTIQNKAHKEIQPVN